jgi:hypothetical protein
LHGVNPAMIVVEFIEDHPSRDGYEHVSGGLHLTGKEAYGPLIARAYGSLSRRTACRPG